MKVFRKRFGMCWERAGRRCLFLLEEGRGSVSMDLSVVIPACSWKQIADDKSSWESEEKWYSSPKPGVVDFGEHSSVYPKEWYKRIAACLRSVTRCPRETIEMECIVFNTSASDETAAVVNRYIQRDKRIKLIVIPEECKEIDVRNVGIEMASGNYILFLDARDRLCEDAWEQIEAAVLEEYADFIAYSYITCTVKKKYKKRYLESGGVAYDPIYKDNGRLKAQMLPISEVISTDMQEACRLMYTEPVFHTCWGKLFKSRIIRDYHIEFRTGVMIGADFLFVSEYFEHCENCFMTKAMIYYFEPKDRSIMRHYPIKKLIDFIRIVYTYHVETVKRYHDKKLTDSMHVYYIKVLTVLFYAYVREYSYNEKTREYLFANALETETVRRILDAAATCSFSSALKRYEYRLLCEGNTIKIRKYFVQKAKLLRKHVWLGEWI